MPGPETLNHSSPENFRFLSEALGMLVLAATIGTLDGGLPHTGIEESGLWHSHH